ncbi:MULTISPECIES: ABC transporter permease [Roseovarius]|uniref:ABC transporter permease n=1 Tax=Roseovarius TaxID=74030 RepID=UPI000C6A6AB4|nr:MULTISPECIES: ABC transporter permease [Roseovarius]MAO26634.1 ABC transporter permease [Roseovarius sp.]MAZ21207.1 ABC transporter permease [Roseovarius sp.]MBU2999802.1 ABC transporter permease [Roseovarius nubinhibens]|tara:strand:+ start:149 stop:970 length:822 start_codon:yes stop_codon:yes gene_type:complete
MLSWLRSPASETQITHGQRLWLYIFAIVTMILLVLPTLIVIPMSFSDSQYLEFPPETWSLRWYEHYFASEEWMQATRTSFKAAFFTMLVATPIGVLAAYGLHASKVPFIRASFVLLITPMMVPVVLIAIGAFYAYVKLQILYTMLGLVLAHSLLAIPLVVIVTGSALKGFDTNLESAARSLGAPRWKAFLTVTLPQIRFAVVTSALLAFLTSFDEVVIAMFVSGGDNPTLTRNMFNALRDQIDPTIASISTLMIVVTTLMMALAQIFGQQRKP